MNSNPSYLDLLRIVLQIVVALGILNVWILRRDRATPYRGGSARNMRDEFAAYGLPAWFMLLIGILKVVFAVALVAGLWVPSLVAPSAIGLGVLMVGAIVMHFRINDPPVRSLPAFAVLVLSVMIILI